MKNNNSNKTKQTNKTRTKNKQKTLVPRFVRDVTDTDSQSEYGRSHERAFAIFRR